ncbi:MAG: FAD-dependent thymidylate synthase [Alphaproteobacteria bacterium]|nr:FAD-dependent thymidylate synthase [Alphaproteobacteria bacterium]OJV15158.1 MAG: FAD-dependent thymidylate synthase [Alphaproteobacteria bacterium 33-17]
MSNDNPTTSQQIEELRNTSYTTIRATVPALEEVLYKPFPLLDHGFIRVIDYMGDDSAIVQAARVSYGKGTKKVNEDAGLINYLMRHKHTTPFEMCDIKFHIKMPIFIARQWIRHRTASVNEYSARYSILSKEFYIPTADNMAKQSTTNRQGREDLLSPDKAHKLMNLLRDDAERCYHNYEIMLNHDEQGNVIDENEDSLARELARMNLTLNYYTEWYWKINLHNLMHFVKLRADSHAQYEIRVYAEVMLDIIKRWVPNTYAALDEYIIGSCSLSRKGTEVVRKMIKGEKVTQETSNMSKREWNELMASLKIEEVDA